MSKRKTTEAEEWAVIGMHDGGNNMTEICSTLKLSSDTVSYILHESGRTPNVKGKPYKIPDEKKEACIRMRKNGDSYQEIAQTLRIGESTARSICHNHKNTETVSESVTAAPAGNSSGNEMPDQLPPVSQIIKGLEQIIKGLEMMLEGFKRLE